MQLLSNEGKALRLHFPARDAVRALRQPLIFAVAAQEEPARAEASPDAGVGLSASGPPASRHPPQHPAASAERGRSPPPAPR
eukprot:13480200-Alexandrium_andersonii.AAC.1